MFSSQVDKSDFTEGLEISAIYFENETTMNSFIKHLLFKFKYVCRNIPGPGADLVKFEEQFCGCDCIEQCLADSCSCLKTTKENYQDKKLLKNIFETEHKRSKAILECNSRCGCLNYCDNRLIQCGIKYKLQIFECENKGFGLRSMEFIPYGAFICEYAGEILSEFEARKRCEKLTIGDMNYLIVLKEHCSSGLIQTFVDPKFKGNIGRMINHSCEPNLTMFPVRIENTIPKLALFANQDIEPLQELSFNYGTNDSNSRDSKNRKPCYCDTSSCIGYLPFDPNVCP